MTKRRVPGETGKTVRGPGGGSGSRGGGSGSRRNGSRQDDSPRNRQPGVLPRVFLILAIAVVAGAAVGVLIDRFELGSLFVKRVQRGGSQSVLLERRDAEELETLAYVRRTVFPHDYLSSDFTMEELTSRIAEFGAPPEDVLTDEALRHFRAANLAAEVGLATRRDQASYVVVTTEYRYGYRVGDILPVIEGVTASQGRDGFETAALAEHLPPPRVLSISTTDIDPERYPYGRVPLDAAEWRAVAEFVRVTDLPDDEWERLSQRGRDAAVAIVLKLIAPSYGE